MLREPEIVELEEHFTLEGIGKRLQESGKCLAEPALEHLQIVR